jgi:cytochrome c peroxidase
MMNRSTLSALLLLAGAALSGGPVSASDKPSVEYGRKLFNDPALGGASGTMSCNSCHPSGKGLGQAGGNPKLSGKINNCITGALKGRSLGADSPEMQSLLLYIRSLSSGSGGY